MRCLSLLLLLLVPTSAFAQAAKPPSFLDAVKRRTALNVVAGYEMSYAGEKADPTLDPGKEFSAGLVGSYLLGPALAVDGGTIYGMDTKQFRSWVRVSYPFFGAQREPIPPAIPAVAE